MAYLVKDASEINTQAWLWLKDHGYEIPRRVNDVASKLQQSARQAAVYYHYPILADFYGVRKEDTSLELGMVICLRKHAKTLVYPQARKIDICCAWSKIESVDHLITYCKTVRNSYSKDIIVIPQATPTAFPVLVTYRMYYNCCFSMDRSRSSIAFFTINLNDAKTLVYHRKNMKRNLKELSNLIEIKVGPSKPSKKVKMRKPSGNEEEKKASIRDFIKSMCPTNGLSICAPNFLQPAKDMYVIDDTPEDEKLFTTEISRENMRRHLKKEAEKNEIDVKYLRRMKKFVDDRFEYRFSSADDLVFRAKLRQLVQTKLEENLLRDMIKKKKTEMSESFKKAKKESAYNQLRNAMRSFTIAMIASGVESDNRIVTEAKGQGLVRNLSEEGVLRAQISCEKASRRVLKEGGDNVPF